MNQQMTEAEELLLEEGIDDSMPDLELSDPSEVNNFSMDNARPVQVGDVVYGMGNSLPTRKGDMKQELQVTVTNNDDPGFTTMWQIVRYGNGIPVAVASKVRKTATRYYRAKGFLPRKPVGLPEGPQLEGCDYCPKQLILGQKDTHMRAFHGGEFSDRLAYEDRQDKNVLSNLLAGQQEQNRLMEERNRMLEQQILELQTRPSGPPVAPVKGKDNKDDDK